MKKIIIVFLAAFLSFTVIAQDSGPGSEDTQKAVADHFSSGGPWGWERPVSST